MKQLVLIFYLKGSSSPLMIGMPEADAKEILAQHTRGFGGPRFYKDKGNTPIPWLIDSAEVQAITAMLPEQLKQAPQQQQQPSPAGLNPMGYFNPKSN